MKQATSKSTSPKMQFDNRFWEGFIQLADPKVWVASTVPMILGAAFTIGQGQSFSMFWFFIALLAIYCIEIGKNGVNEYVDYHTGVDLYVTEENRTPFSGGKKTLIDKKLTIKEVYWISVVTLAAGFLIGLCIVAFKEPLVLGIGLAGFIVAVFYTLPPIKFAYRGLGELAVAIAFGPLIVSGIYVMMTGTFEPILIFVSLPTACLIANVLWINEYPDYEADVKGNKRNMLVKVGKEKGIYVYIGLFTLAHIFVILLALLMKNPFWLLGLLTIPTSIKAVKVLKKYYNNTQKLMPANAMTTQIYLLNGLLLAVAAFTELFI